MDINNFLKKYEKDLNLFDSLLNIYLVYKYARKSTLLQFGYKPNKKILNIIFNFIKSLKLNYYPSNLGHPDYPSYFVYYENTFKIVPDKNTKTIGKALEMFDAGLPHNYFKKEHMYGHIYENKTKSYLYTEICSHIDKFDDFEKSIIEKTKKWNDVIKKDKMKYKIVYALIYRYGSHKLYDKLIEDDFFFIKNNKYEYINELTQLCFSDVLTHEYLNNIFSKIKLWNKYKNLITLIFFITVYEHDSRIELPEYHDEFNIFLNNYIKLVLKQIDCSYDNIIVMFSNEIDKPIYKKMPEEFKNKLVKKLFKRFVNNKVHKPDRLSGISL
jgi:hypothetical protein